MKFKKPPMKFPALLIGKQKHGDLYYIAQSLEGLHRAALELVRFRKENDHCYLDPNVSGDFEKFFEEESNGITLDEYKKIKKSLGDKASQVKFEKDNATVEDYFDLLKRRHARYIENKKIHDAVNKALEENDGKMALAILYRNSDNQYEGVEVEYDVGEYT